MQNLLFRMSDTPGEVRHAGRRLGQDTDDVLASILGLAPAEIERLHDAGVVHPRTE